jgi:putative hemolysin
VTADTQAGTDITPRGSFHALGHSSSFSELRAGALGLRIASTRAEIDAVQALRYRVFYEEMGAAPSADIARSKRDYDVFDTVADHLVVVDHAIGSGAEGVVGTYRMLQREGADAVGQFYSADEYDISSLLRFPGRLLELGRSCVDSNYRGRAVMQLLWRGIAAYVFQHEIDLMFGCASLAGTDPDQISAELTYLFHNHLAPPALRPTALPGRYIDMRRQQPGLVDPRRVQLMLPPLIKGYLRMGAMIGDGAVIDHQFNTTDVAIVVKTDLVTDRYIDHYKRQMRD